MTLWSARDETPQFGLLCCLFLLGAVPLDASATVSFGAAVLGPVSGAPFDAPGLVSLAPVRRAAALSLTRVSDATSATLQRARAGAIHYVPLDPNAPTAVDSVTTGAAGHFGDTPSVPFVEAIAFYAGNDDYNSSSAFCPM